MRALLDQAQLVDLRERLRRTRWSGVAGDGWATGVERAWLRELVADWGRWDPNGFQDQLDAVEHLST